MNVLNPLAWTFRSRMLVGAAICLALVGFAFYTQLGWGLEPCELCIRQRVVYLLLAGVFVLAAVVAPQRRGGRAALGVLAAADAAVGVFLAGKQIALKLFPPELPTCSIAFDIPAEPTLWQQMFTATAECGLGGWTFLGLSMPAWSLIWFVLLGVWALWAGFRAD